MPISIRGRRRSCATVALLLGAVLSVTACGQQRGRVTTAAAPSAPPSLPGSTSSAGASPGPSAPGASPYVEPGAGDGAPHYQDNNAHRRPGEMSPADAKDARREADRIEPVLKRLWERKKWDPKSVRAALLALGYEEVRTGPKGERLGGKLDVRGMEPRFEGNHYVTPEGTRVGLRVHDDACVTAFVQKSNFQVSTNGPYMESGCFEPPFGH
ncbi:hypothetical protein ACIRPT_06165 [Streptomyces sp. NPDC101227]|uniref:hypothetical protein n=1 Tax=Streptomyces sp. NPDC101227 TaxID=3366136 RepID=UPI0038226425